MSQKELEIISEGRSLGWTDSQCLLAVQQHRHNIKVAAEKRRREKEAEAKAEAERVEKKKEAGTYHELEGGIEITEDALNEDTYTIINGKPYTKEEFGEAVKNKTISADEIRQGGRNTNRISNFRLNLKKEKRRIKKAENVEDWYGLDDVDTKTNTFNFKDAGDLEKNILKGQGIDTDVEYFKEGDKWFYKNEERENIEVTNLLAKANLNLKIETGSEFKDFDKIISSSATWTGADGKPKKLDDNLLDYRDDDFVANTLSREYGDDFEFFDSGNDKITARSKSTGEELEFETNFVGGGGKKEIASGKKLIQWMKTQKFGDFKKKSQADYRAIKNSKGELEWHYVNKKGEDLGVIKSKSITDELNSTYPEALNEYANNEIKVIEDDTGEKHYNYRDDKGDWVKLPKNIAQQVTKVHGDANEKEEDGVIYNFGESRYEAIIKKEKLDDEHNRRSSMSFEEYMKTEWNPNNTNEKGVFEGFMGRASYAFSNFGELLEGDFGRSDYEAWKKQAESAANNANVILEKTIKPKDNTQEKITTEVNLLKEEYNNTETTSERKEELKSKIKETQSEWSKFYDEKDFEGWEDLDLNDFNEYVKNTPLFKQLDVTTFGEDISATDGLFRETGSAELKWDENKQKYFWSGGTGEGDVYTIDTLKAQVLTGYLSEKISGNMKTYDAYEDAGTFDQLNLLDEHAENVAKLDERVTPLIKEYDKLKQGIDDGTIDKTEENINKLNSLAEDINNVNEVINEQVDSYNRIANDETNNILFDGYKDLVNRNATLTKNLTTLVDPNNTSAIGKIASNDYHERLDEQERLNKLENGHWGWQAASIGEGLWTGLVNGMTGIVGLAEAYVPELWSDTDAKTKAQVMNKWSATASNFTWNAVADGNMIDPETGELNWSAVPSQVAPIVLDMYLMTQSGGALGATKTAIVGGAKRLVSKGGDLLNITNKTLPKFRQSVLPIQRRLGKISTKLDIVNRGNQFTGGMMIMLPKNIKESVSQVDEDFTYEDALNSAFYKTVTESGIEMINPDIRLLKGMQKFKGTKGFGDMRKWNPNVKGFKDNGKKMLDIFYQNLKQVPQELIEENLQETANMMWNGYYNQKHNTEFHIPTAEDYKALNVLTPLSVLTAGFIRTRGFTKGKPNASMYQAAVENYDEFSAEMKKEVERFRQSDGKRGLDPKDFRKIMTDVDGYVAVKNKIDIDEYNEMSIAERIDTLSLLYTQEQLKKKIREEKDPKEKSKLEKDLKNLELDIQKVANSVTTGVMTRGQQELEMSIARKKRRLLGSELGSDARMKLRKEIAKDLKRRNELREKADAFEFNGKSYNSAKDFLNAINKAEQNGYFDNINNRPRIRIGNKVSPQMAEYLSNKIANLTKSNNYRQGEVLMKTSDVQEAEDFHYKKENQGKTIENYKQELDQENESNSPDVNKLNDLRNVIKFLGLQDRGYEYSSNAGGMVIQGKENKAIRDLAQQQMQDRIDAVNAIGDVDGGLRTVVLPASVIKDQEGKNGPFAEGAHKANAMVIEQVNPETGKIEQVVVLNSDVAMKSKSFSAVSHELLHVILFSVLNGPTRIVNGYETRITEKGVDLIKGFLDLLPPDQKRKLENELQIRGYKHEENKDGSINFDKPKPFEVYAEEYLNHYHDLVVKETDPNKRIPLNDPDTRGIIKKIGDYFKSFFKQETNEDMSSVMDGNLDTPKQVLEFLRNFNKQAIENKFDEQLTQRIIESQRFYGDIAQEEDQAITPYSRAEQEVDQQTTLQEKARMVEEVNKIYNDPNLSDPEKQFEIAQKYRGMAESRFNVALSQAVGDSRDILLQNKEDIIAQMLYDPGDGTVKARNVLGLVKDFETARHKYGNIAAYINAYFKVRSYEVFEKWTKDKGFKKSMEDSQKEISEMESQTEEAVENRGLQSGQILVSERIVKDDPYNEGKKQRVNNYIQNIQTQVKENPNVYEGKTYKTLIDLNPKGTVSIMMSDPTAVYKDDGTPFWQTRKGKKLVGTSIIDSIVKKLKNNDNLNQQDIKAIQPYLSKHNQLLWTALPQGFMTDKNGRPTTATGVQNVLLEPFYNKGARKGNLYPQYKLPNMPNNFLEVFGITPRGEVNLTEKETNVSQRVKALISQHGKILTNQSVRQELFTNGADPDVVNNIANGKSVMVYAKDIVQGDVNPETNEIEPGFGNQEAERVGEIIRMYHTDRKSFDFLKELDPIFVGVVEEMFIYPNPNLGQGLNYIPSIMLDKYTPKEFLKNNFKGKSYTGPKLFDTKQPDNIGEYQTKYVEEAVAFGSTFHPDFNFQALKFLLGFKIGKTINPNLYKDQLTQIENRVFTQEQIEIEEKFMIDNGLNPTIINKSIKMINSSEVSNILNDISTQPNLKAKEAKLEEYKPRLQEINRANENAMKYVSLKMKQAYNDSKIISPHFVYFNGQVQTNIIEGTRSLSTFEYMYLTEEQQIPLFKDKKGNVKLLKKPKKEKGQSNVNYYSSENWNQYIKAWKKVGEWQERYDVNSNTVTEKEIKLAGSKKAAIEVATVNDLNWKNEHVGASATTHAERSSYVWSNGKSVDLEILGHDHRSAWVPKYLADKYFDAKIMIGGKEVDNKTSYEGPMRMTKFGKNKSSNIFHVSGQKLIPYLTKAENISEIVQDIRDLSSEQLKKQQVFSKAVNNANKTNHLTPSRGMSAFDFDETLIDKGDNTIIATKGEDVVEISSSNWPLQGPQLAADGYDFDFSDFVNVKGGVEGPLMQKFRNRIAKYGIENNYILTARPAEAAPAIQAWLKEQGIDMPLENITGLGNSTGEAKAMWMAEKFAEGYNDMYFVDDALPNVEAVADMLEQLDIKGSSVQAKIQFSRDISPTFSRVLDGNVNTELDLNRILEQTKGVKAEAVFSEAQAKIRGSAKGKWKFWVPYSAEDFKGLVYRFIGKGRQGEAQIAFFKKALFDPFERAYEAMNMSKQQLNNQYKELLKQFSDVEGILKEEIVGGFTTEQAVRVYLWNKNGMEIPGLSQRDLKALVAAVESNMSIKEFANNLGLITNQELGYLEPTEYWTVENIDSDINKINNEINREDHLAEWRQNKEIMFGVWGNDGRLVGDNINKIEAIYGTRFREALEDILWRMEFGRKREAGSNRLVNAFNNWANQSVGAIMFFNMRSALLQTISSINYLNWSDNNPLKAGAALLNFPQFIKDFTMIFNSDMLKQRRAGNQRGINEAELAQAVEGVGVANRVKAILHYLLTKGFLPTQIADSFAISSGGATFYRNRVNTYLKQGMTQEQAEARAFRDFAENTEESQQSSRPDMISQQQASPLGRYILAFKNTPMQYARLTKKAFLDLANRRGDAKTNIGKIIYYMAVQNLIFSALQAALGTLIGADDDEKEKEKAYEKVLNSMVDSILGGLGFGGNVAMTMKNTILEYNKQEGKEWNADHTYTILKFFGLSPTISSKGRKLYSAIQTEKYNKDVRREMSLLDIDNPVYSIIGNIVSATTNLPLDRLVKKVDNVDAALTEDITAIERFALLMGWNTWDLKIDDSDVVAVEDEIKEKKKIEREEKRKIKKEEKKKKKEEEDKIKEEENKKKKDDICIAIGKSGKRCKNKAESGGYCTVHAKVEQGTKEVQCSKIKSDGNRCKMKTKAKSGLCYYHD